MITNRVNRLTNELCDEIDCLRAELEASQSREKHWREEYAKLQNNCIQDSHKTIGTLLTHALKMPERKVA